LARGDLIAQDHRRRLKGEILELKNNDQNTMSIS